MLLIYLTVLRSIQAEEVFCEPLVQDQDTTTFLVKDTCECHLRSFRSSREKATMVEEKDDGIRKYLLRMMNL